MNPIRILERCLLPVINAEWTKTSEAKTPHSDTAGILIALLGSSLCIPSSL